MLSEKKYDHKLHEFKNQTISFTKTLPNITLYFFLLLTFNEMDTKKVLARTWINYLIKTNIGYDFFFQNKDSQLHYVNQNYGPNFPSNIFFFHYRAAWFMQTIILCKQIKLIVKLGSVL